MHFSKLQWFYISKWEKLIRKSGTEKAFLSFASTEERICNTKHLLNIIPLNHSHGIWIRKYVLKFLDKHRFYARIIFFSFTKCVRTVLKSFLVQAKYAMKSSKIPICQFLNLDQFLSRNFKKIRMSPARGSFAFNENHQNSGLCMPIEHLHEMECSNKCS